MKRSMFEETYEHPLTEYWEKLKPHQSHFDRGQWRQRENSSRENVFGFLCRHCQAYVYALPTISGVQNRNHCPFCLWSRHVDHSQAGDRMSPCKAIMQPIGLTVKQSRNKYENGGYGELMLIHRCSECAKLSINRIAADDWPDRLMETFYASAMLDAPMQQQLAASGIRLLLEEDVKLVVSQIHGIMQN
jgi:hypothetical protein